EQTAAQYGYQKTSIWTYARPEAKKYTSVTRESFIGVGAGAASQFGNYFYVNTFNVDAYIERVNRGRLPINLVNEMTEKERMVFWLFWRCYEASIDTVEFQQLFKTQLKEEFPLLFKAMRLFSLVKEEGKTLKLTSRGAYLYHLIEKHYSKTYLNDMWAAGMSRPWHDSFRL
ncbi:MAG TPA: coproporphyrinogen III oxidase family protein, partial [Firmicutes bacterium]|nr:coproporphyrinogen III oxidase family protein [Bacillota bacterium]